MKKSINIEVGDLLHAVDLGLLVQDPFTSDYKLNKSLDVNFFETSYGFESIAIKQQKNKALSRLDVDISSEIIRGIIRPNPLIAANMSTVINAEFYKKLYSLGSFAFLHRAQSQESLVREVVEVSKSCKWVGVSVGVGPNVKNTIDELVFNGANVILIDIAHGYSQPVIELGRWIKSKYPNVKVVVGNTVNPEMMYEVADFADAVKVGIAQGLACETKNTAGATEKQFSAILKFKEISKELGIPIISCGGIREPADVVKAVAAGANSVMIGSVFAACPESAAEYYNDNTKIYAGMASEYVQNKWKGGLKPGTCSEGGIRYLEVSESVDKIVERYEGSLRSGITYAGELNVPSFQNNVKFVKLC